MFGSSEWGREKRPLLGTISAVLQHCPKGEAEELLTGDERDCNRARLRHGMEVPESCQRCDDNSCRMDRVTLKNLSTALKMLNEAAAPEGKKAQWQAAAEGAAADGNKFAPRTGPRLAVSNS